MKVSSNNQDLLFKLGIGAVAYLVFAKPILNFLGITKGAGERMAEFNSSNASSPFNTSLWSKYFYVSGTSGSGRKLITPALADKIKSAASLIYGAMGYLTDTESEVQAGFKMMDSKAMVSLLSNAFNTIYGKDLIEYLRKGKDLLPENGLSDAELKVIFNYVASLPLK